MRCITIDLLNVLGKKWDATLLEQIDLNNGINFDRLLSINLKLYPKTLNKALGDLIKRNLIAKRIYYNGKIKRSEYSMTETGRALLASFESFKKIECAGKVAEIKGCGECELGPNSTNQ